MFSQLPFRHSPPFLHHPRKLQITVAVIHRPRSTKVLVGRSSILPSSVAAWTNAPHPYPKTNLQSSLGHRFSIQWILKMAFPSHFGICDGAIRKAREVDVLLFPPVGWSSVCCSAGGSNLFPDIRNGIRPNDLQTMCGIIYFVGDCLVGESCTAGPIWLVLGVAELHVAPITKSSNPLAVATLVAR